MNFKKISVIVPAFNIGEKIIPCLDSLCHQTELDAEFLIINDGSTDNTKQVIEDYISEKNDERFKYFEKMNSGLAATRNYGIKKASGEYVWYVDADDLVLNNNAIKNLYNQANNNNLDILEFNFQKLDLRGENEKKYYALPLENIDKVISGKDLINLPFLDIAEWHFLWKRSFIINNNLLLDTSVWGGEDVLNTIPIVSKANRAMYIGDCYYEYILSENSTITANKNKKKAYLDDAFYALDRLNDWLKQQSLDVQKNSQVSNHIVKMFIGRVMEAYINDYPISNKYIRNFLKNKNLNYKDKVKYVLLTTLPKKLRKKLSIKLF
nr:glycosyltransferase [uncultured Ligilactobacillus sp.]